jgi:hypothetical protein
MNEVFKNLVQWLEGHNLLQTMDGFKDLSSLLNIQSAIQIHIYKPKSHVFATYDYYFKVEAYNMQLKAIVDHRKQFLDVFMGMLRSMNDVKVLCPSSIYHKAT